ncbi:MAG TPA: aminoglycoside phosphotransferase family protein [Anaerolineae bacterium]|nr:aminoglycoside phosphotransferase family protein [Anaerolineae bacterium]
MIDFAHAQTFLVSRFGGEVSDVSSLGAGVWSQAFAFRRAGCDYVIRFGAHGDDFARDRLAAAFAGPALPIPAVLELGAAFDGYYAIAGRVFGGYIDDVHEAKMRGLLPALLAALDAMRLADLSHTTGCGGWDVAGNAPHVSWRAALLDVANDRPGDRIHGWRARLAASAVGSGPFDESYRRLQALAGDLPDLRCLIHSDLLHYNVLVEGDRISGVLDWGCAMTGDFLYDLAWLCFWQPWYPAWQRIDFVQEAHRHYAAIDLAVPGFEQRLRCCQLHLGLAGMAYQAYAGDWTNLEDTARRTLDLASS